MELCTIEEQDPDRAIAAYRQIIAEQPTHAWAHYRLARLVEFGRLYLPRPTAIIFSLAITMVCRCAAYSSLETSYKRVGHRHPGSIIWLTDRPCLDSKSRHGILDAELFHDNVHPNLAGHIALAEAVLGGLKARSAFGWPESTPAPVLDPQQCADEFGIDASGLGYGLRAVGGVLWAESRCFSSDLAERIQWRDRYATAARQIRAGARPEDVGIPGVGVAAAISPQHQ